MILHVLGGGPAQLSAIKRAKEKGLEVLVSDLDQFAPGFELSDYTSLASTFDQEAVSVDARKFGSDYLMTTGTDQPVLTAASVSEKLKLPYFLTKEQALIVTNKKVMKNRMKQMGIPTMPFVILDENFLDAELQSLNFPLVIKPLDSQGQRGVLKVYTPSDIRENFKKLLGFSRLTQILAEEFYLSNEITISGWVENSTATIYTITDRVTVDNGPHLGVCLSHRYPSLYIKQEAELKELTNKIVKMIGMEIGPIYFQILAGETGFIVNEIACRLGGAYEDEFIPYMTGISLLDNMIDMSVGIKYNNPEQVQINNYINGKFMSLQMFFADPGIICIMDGMEKVLAIDGVLNGRFLLKKGTVIEPTENSTQRVGYFIVTGESSLEVNRKVLEAYNYIVLENENGLSMLQYNKRMLFPI